MIKRFLKNERGDLSYFSVFMILAINMVMAFLLFFSSVQINTMNIKNAAKMELNNISARIYADTFHSQREANLVSYMSDLTVSSSYTRALHSSFVDGLSERIELQNESYSLSDIELTFYNRGDHIEYIMTCDAAFYIEMLGNLFPPITKHITLTGTHITKY